MKNRSYKSCQSFYYEFGSVVHTVISTLVLAAWFLNRRCVAVEMSVLSCSFSSFCKSHCDISPRFPNHNEYFPLNTCTKDIRSHLRQVKVSQRCLSSEKDLIIARAGLYKEDGIDMTICPMHRCELGMMWRPKRKCQHPLHGKRTRKPDRGANLKISEEIMKKWHVLIPVGSGKIKKIKSICLSSNNMFVICN